MSENQEFEEVANGASEEMTTEVYEEAGDEAQQEEAMQQEGDENGDDKAQENLDDRKIFVGGLSWNTTEADLKEYFEKYGPVENSELKVDPGSSRSRGFGFVTFKDAETIEKVLEQKEPHMLHKKQIDPKHANPRPTKEPKIFVGGVDPTTTKEDLESHFAKFGKVKEVVLPFDTAKKQRRPYVFVTFESLEGSNAAIAEPKQTICEKECDVNEATPQQDKMGNRRGGFRGYRGGPPRGRGRGRGRGGWNDYYQGYDQGYYGNDYYNQGYYDYNYDYYGGYGGYDNYYNYGYDQNYDWNYYNQGYDQSGASGEQGYDQTQVESTETDTTAEGGQQQTSYGKQRGRGGGQTNYHPYSR